MNKIKIGCLVILGIFFLIVAVLVCYSWIQLPHLPKELEKVPKTFPGNDNETRFFSSPDKKYVIVIGTLTSESIGGSEYNLFGLYKNGYKKKEIRMDNILNRLEFKWLNNNCFHIRGGVGNSSLKEIKKITKKGVNPHFYKDICVVLSYNNFENIINNYLQKNYKFKINDTDFEKYLIMSSTKDGLTYKFNNNIVVRFKYIEPRKYLIESPKGHIFLGELDENYNIVK